MINLRNHHGFCRAVVRGSTVDGGKHLPSQRGGLSILCKKPDNELCAGYIAAADLSANPACMARLVGFLRKRILDGTLNEVSIVSPYITRVYPSDQVRMIKEISETIDRIQLKVNELRRRTFQCKFMDSEECSKSRRGFIQRISDADFVAGDPIKAYINVLAEKRSSDTRKGKCSSCGRAYSDFLESLRQLFLEMKIVSKFLESKLNYDEKDREMIYSHFFHPSIIPRTPLMNREEPTQGYRPAEAYEIGPYRISISTCGDRGENFYSVSSLTDSDSSFRRIVMEVTSQIKKIPEASPNCTFLNLDELLRIREQEGMKQVTQRFPEIPHNVISSISELSSYKSIGIECIAPFLIDEHVEEFFIDRPGAPVYLDHSNWGRCRTNIVPCTAELKKIETRLRAESGFRLDRLNPSIKTEVATRRFAVRASLDISPLAADGFHLDIRKLEAKHLSLVALIKNRTLSSEAAAYLYFCVLRKRNIVAIGEPGSGKTTMINALDLLTPPHWRKITIEDAIESIPQTELGKHQVRLRVEPFEERKKSRSKSREIISLLHRTPDLVYLGEIQTASHSKALFHALSAGLTGLQTCHADSPEQVIVRWVVHHKIAPVCLNQIGILIHMKKVGVSAEGIQKRRVVRICEVRENRQATGLTDFSSSAVQLIDIFKWNPLTDSLTRMFDLFETSSIHAIREYEDLTKPMFEDEIYRYKSLFETLAEKNEADINSTARLFNEVFKEQVKL